MSERTYWIIMGAWTLVVIGAVLGMWWTIRKQDEKIEANERETEELLAEAEAFNARKKGALEPDYAYKARTGYEEKEFALDPENHEHPTLPRAS